MLSACSYCEIVKSSSKPYISVVHSHATLYTAIVYPTVTISLTLVLSTCAWAHYSYVHNNKYGFDFTIYMTILISNSWLTRL